MSLSTIKHLIIKGAVPALMLTGLITAVVAYHDAKTSQEGYNNALKKAAAWIIGWNLLGAFFVFNISPQGIADSIGYTNCQFIRELSFYHLGMAVAVLLALQKNWNIDAIRALSVVWSVFAFLAGSYHLYEIIEKKNYSFNNVIPFFLDYTSAAGMMFLAVKAKNV